MGLRFKDFKVLGVAQKAYVFLLSSLSNSCLFWKLQDGGLSPPWCICMFMYKEMWVYVSLCLSMMYGRVCTSHEYVWCVLSPPSRPGQDGKFPNRVCRELSRVRTPIKVSIYGSFFLGSEIVRLMFFPYFHTVF